MQGPMVPRIPVEKRAIRASDVEASGILDNLTKFWCSLNQRPHIVRRIAARAGCGEGIVTH